MRLLKIFVLSTLISTFAFAQENLPNNGYALSFGISQNFTLSDFNGFIAFKKIFNSGNQLRFLLRPEYTHFNDKNEDSSSNDNMEETANSSFISVGADYLWRLLQNNNVQMYGGGGFLIGYGNSKTEQTTTVDDSTRVTIKKLNSWQYEIRGILGAEWMVSKNIGLHAEYILNFKLKNSERNSDYYGSFKGTEKTNRFDLNHNVFFGISFYL